jgi:hypothetical protein
MRFLFNLSTFIMTMVLSLIAFTYTAINHPTAMRDLLAGAQHVRDSLQQLTLPDSYMVWVDIFLQPNQIVLVGISIAVRIALGLLFSLAERGRSPQKAGKPAGSPASEPPFGRWG